MSLFDDIDSAAEEAQQGSMSILDRIDAAAEQASTAVQEPEERFQVPDFSLGQIEEPRVVSDKAERASLIRPTLDQRYAQNEDILRKQAYDKRMAEGKADLERMIARGQTVNPEAVLFYGVELPEEPKPKKEKVPKGIYAGEQTAQMEEFVTPESPRAYTPDMRTPVSMEEQTGISDFEVMPEPSQPPQAERPPVSVWDIAKRESQELLGYAPEQALAISTQALDFFPGMMRGAKQLARSAWTAAIGEEKTAALEQMSFKIPVLGEMLKKGDQLLEASGELKKDARDLLMAKAMEQGGLPAVAAGQIVETVQGALQFLWGMKKLGIGYGGQAGVKTTLKAAGARAVIMAATAEDLTPAERLQTLGIGFAYQATPALSGTIGKWAKRDWVAKVSDVAANFGITAPQLGQMVDSGYAQAEAAGKPELSNFYTILEGIKSFGADVVFGMMTRAFRKQGHTGAAREMEKIVRKTDIAKQIKRITPEAQAEWEKAVELETKKAEELPIERRIDDATEKRKIKEGDLGEYRGTDAQRQVADAVRGDRYARSRIESERPIAEVGKEPPQRIEPPKTALEVAEVPLEPVKTTEPIPRQPPAEIGAEIPSEVGVKVGEQELLKKRQDYELNVLYPQKEAEMTTLRQRIKDLRLSPEMSNQKLATVLEKQAKILDEEMYRLGKKEFILPPPAPTTTEKIETPAPVTAGEPGTQKIVEARVGARISDIQKVETKPEAPTVEFPSLLEFAKSKLPKSTAAQMKDESQVESYRAQWNKERQAQGLPVIPKPETPTTKPLTDKDFITKSLTEIKQAATAQGIEVAGKGRKQIVDEVKSQRPPEDIYPTGRSGFASVPSAAPGLRFAYNYIFRQHGGVDERIVPHVESWARQRNVIDLSAKMMADQVRDVKLHLKKTLSPEAQREYSADITKVMEQQLSLDNFKKKHSAVFVSADPAIRSAAEKTANFLKTIRDYREGFIKDILPVMKRINMSDEAATIEANKLMYVPYEYMKWIDPSYRPKPADKERAVDTVKSEYIHNIMALRDKVNSFKEYDAILKFLKTGDKSGLAMKDANEEIALQTLRNDYLGLSPFIRDLRLDPSGKINFDTQLGSIQSSAREYIDSLLGKKSQAGTGNPFDTRHLLHRKLPEVFRQLYGKIEDPERVVSSMVKIQQNLLNTTRFLDQIMSMNSDPNGKPMYAKTPVPEQGLTEKLSGRQYAALDGMYVTKELGRILKNDVVRVRQTPETMTGKVAAEIGDTYRLAVKSARTAAIFTQRLVMRNILTNTAYPFLSGDWLRGGHIKHQKDGWVLAKDVYQYMAGRISVGSERYNRTTKMLKELVDNGVFHIKQSGMGADLDAFAREHGYMSTGDVPSKLKAWYEKQLDEARSYYSLADLPYKYAMWKTALERYKGDKTRAKEHVHRYGQYPEKLGRGLKKWSKLPFADFPTFMFDAVRIHGNATVDFAKNVATLGRGGDWQQVVGYLIGTALGSQAALGTANLTKQVVKKGLDLVKKIVSDEEPDTEFAELTPEQEGAMYDLVPNYDRNNPSYMWKEIGKDGTIKIKRIPMRGFATPYPTVEIAAGVINRNAMQAGGWNEMLKDEKRLAKIPFEIVGEFGRNLLQTGMVPQAMIRTMLGQEAGLVKTSAYKSPEGGLLGIWKSEDPRKFQKIARVLYENGTETFPLLFMSQQQQRNLKRIAKEAGRSPLGYGDPTTQKTMTDVAVNSVVPLRLYTLDAMGARAATLQNISPFINEIQDAKRKKDIDHDLIQHHFSVLIDRVAKAKKAFVDTGVVKEDAFWQMLVDTQLSKTEAEMIYEGEMPLEYVRKEGLSLREKFEEIQK